MTTTTATKRDWHHQVEHERLPANEVHQTNDGKTIRIEYREENGTIYKTTKTYRSQKIKVLPIVAERKKWKKFGNSLNDPSGINTATTKVDDEIQMQFISNKDDDKQDEEKIIQEAVSSLKKVQCRFCKADHWTAKCPYKDNLQPIVESSDAKINENSSSSTNNPSYQQQNPSNSTSNDGQGGKWISRRAAAAAANSHERNPTNRSSNLGGPSSRMNDPRKQDEATVRVTNLPEETQDHDLRDLFTPFGLVSRVYLAKDKVTNTSKGFGFITFHDKKDAQKAIECVSGFGYDHLILKVEWANKPNV